MNARALPSNAAFPTSGTSVVQSLSPVDERGYRKALADAPQLAAALTYRAPAPEATQSLDNVPDFVPPTPRMG